jgi:uncharacterized SAM-binding protein YcdF (DUF218 family)
MHAQPGSRPAGSSLARRILFAQLIALLMALGVVPFMGRLLYIEDQLERGDAILVLAGARTARWLEARDLLNGGYAQVILLSSGPREWPELKLERHGIRLPAEGEVARNALIQLGVPADRVLILSGNPDNTAAEGAMLKEYASARGWRTVIVVTSKLHTRRAAFAMRRALAGAPVRVVMRATRYDDDEPERWWRKRRTIRTVMCEAPKLVAYLFGLGP